MTIGRKLWVIPEGYIPPDSLEEKGTRFVSHEAACLLNANDEDAHIEITLYFVDKNPVGPYRVPLPARRTKHLRFNDLEDPERVPRDTPFSSVIESDIPIVVQHTRLDSRREALGLLSTIAWTET
ncbi:MAG: sensory rhodopsin transducer [Rhodanobacteraceae bacterium]